MMPQAPEQQPIELEAVEPERGSGVLGLLRAVAVVFTGNLVARGLGFLFPLVLARVTHREDFALVYFFVNTGFAVGELVMAGFPTAMTRFISAEPDHRGVWTGSALLGGLPLLVASVAVGSALAIQTSAPPVYMAVVVVGLTIDAYYFALLRGLGWFGTLMLYRVAANAGQLIVLLVAAQLGVAGVAVAIGAYSLFYLVPIAVIELARAPLRSTFGQPVLPDRASLRKLARFSIPALISGLAYSAIQGLDIYFVRVFAAGHLADYSAARSLAMPMQLVPFAVTVILLPRIAAASPVERVRLLRLALATAVTSLALASLAYAVAAGPLVSLVFPSSYREAAHLLVYLAPAMGLVGVYSVLSQWWMGTGCAAIPALCVSLAAVLAVAMDVVLMPTLGPAGAPASMSLGAVAAVAMLGTLTLGETGRSRRVARLLASRPGWLR